ncbi:hypothetical protein CFP71_02895 [Amycolatopsis thailandensis]|uniref:Uncharacterized protein n=1 Tax=Amycolatopsis thailandensis TaxID=589330 RepID=A0A229SI01_9PSEU|nr:DUF6002 family protein [Amycolatopsis thailandensis]OXM58503.1 hypothetical protein CFP71_02895 [Amycolatopsis thailandensis]
MHRAELNVPDAFARYWTELEEALARTEARRSAAPGGPTRFSPPFRFPPRGELPDGATAASALALGSLGEYRGKQLRYLDLARNPGTRTTKSFGSLAIVLRAVAHTRATGEPIMLVTPSSANKASALRDAVGHAYQVGLATPRTLRVSVVIPATGLPKLWASTLDTDANLRSSNPICVCDAEDPEVVKELVREFSGRDAERIAGESGFRLWESQHIDNYLVADVVRGFAEFDAWGVPRNPRLHVHAVSSAYGLLGHALGARIRGAGAPANYLLIQHLATPDLVLWSHTGRMDEADLPSYTFDPTTNRYRQDESPYFPPTVEDLHECVEPTFYTRRPPTVDQIADWLPGAKGRGMVVSREECRSRYPEVAERLAVHTQVRPAASAAEVREWSTIMAVTGAMNAIDRGLVAEDEIVIHGSGCYDATDVGTRPSEFVRPVASAADVADIVTRACLHPADDARLVRASTNR